MKEKRVEADENKAPLFSNPEILEESINKKPLECQRTEVARLNKYIKQKMGQKKPSIVAYLAPYGSGKSVVLENAIKELPGSCKIIEYDIWQCSSKKDVWEDFLIQFLSKVENKTTNKIIDEIDGTKLKWKNLLLFGLIYIVISGVVWFIFSNPQNWFMDFMKSFLIYAAPVFLVLAGINKLFPVYESRAKTLFQYEDKIKQKVLKNEGPIVIILEDIDRSGDTGYKFLETLKCFFVSNIKNGSIMVICPQKNLSFGSVEYDRDDYWTSVGRLERSIKIYDDVVYGVMPKKISPEYANELLTKAGCTDQKLIDVVGLLIDTCSSESLFTMRSLSFLLRNTASFVKSNQTADPALSFFFLSYKFLDSKNGIGASAMIKEIISSGINLTSNPGDPRIRLACRLFDIDLNKYPNSVRLQFGDLEPSYGDLNYRCHRHVTNSGWIVCDINLKYKDLMKSISH